MSDSNLEAAEDKAINAALWLDRLCVQIATETGATPDYGLQLLQASGLLPGLLEAYGLSVRPADTPLVPSEWILNPGWTVPEA